MKDVFAHYSVQEEKNRVAIARAGTTFHVLAVLTPPSANLAVACEVSSLGFLSFDHIYKNQIHLKRNLTQVYFKSLLNKKPQELLNFFKNREHIIQLESRIPENYWTGIWISLAWCVLFYGLSMFLYKRRTAPNAKAGEMDGFEIAFNTDTHYCLKSKRRDFFEHFLANLEGTPGKNGTMTITIDDEPLGNGEPVDDGEVADNDEPVEYIYLPNAQNLPRHISGRSLVRFLARIGNVPATETAELMDCLGEEYLGKRAGDIPEDNKALLLLKATKAAMAHRETPARLLILDNLRGNLEDKKPTNNVVEQIKAEHPQLMVVDFYDHLDLPSPPMAGITMNFKKKKGAYHKSSNEKRRR